MYDIKDIKDIKDIYDIRDIINICMNNLHPEQYPRLL